ncbi:tudor domain-containing protein 3 [Culex quinquefasciatus]|uniref:tudor domain-containing protein 3 n=1 Tax=Culex quinquefasciatus TaxID=7176 RepID=UPI0018E2B699|nr:tudor domain-containing protein 3 [Culex quinquefasciatus]
MGLLEQLQEQGWHLLPAGIERLLEGTPGSTLDAKQAIKLALDIDLREIGGGALGSISARGTKADSFDGNVVVQVLKVRNISAPKANEESKAAPRLLKLTITDGQTQYSALEGEHVPSLSLDTAPGTKIYLKNGPIKILQGMLILNANNVSILGGKVPALFDKWELTRAMAKYAKGGRMQLSASGPPPWIPFGQKIQQNIPSSDTKNFKSLQTKEKDESKENAEFTALRNDAIAEANKLGTKKTFGGGAKQMVDANVQKIMDKGFSEEQANHALKLTRNNVQRALGNLQRIEERRQRDQPFSEDGGDFKAGKVEPPQRMGKPSFRGKRESESDGSSKPSAKVSLFDFLEDILPETDASANKKSSSKESTPFGGKDGKPGADRYESKYNSYSGSNHNNRSSAPNPYQSNSSSSYNSGSAAASKSYNQQRFENNISSSFANRNTHPGPGNRSYGQQNSQHQNSNPSGGYKQQQQSSYNDYNSNRGYRGGPPNSTGGGAGYHASEGHPRGGRPESKYNQSHSSYNNPHQQSQQQYRSDSYNNNTSSNSNAGSQGNSKYASSSGKSQPTSNSSYGGYGAHTDSRGPQSYNGQADGSGGAGRKHPGYQQQQQQQQSSYQGNKPVQGYNATGGAAASVGNHTGGQASNAANNNHYGQQHSAGGATNNYNNSNSTQGIKPAKGSRYTKEDSQKFSGPPPKSTTTTTQAPPPQPQPTQARNSSGPPQKVNQSPPQHGTPASGMQPPFVSGNNKQPSPGPPGSAVSNNNINNNNAKMAQLTEATAGMQIGNSKPLNNNNSQVKPHQQQAPMVSGPPPPATTPVVPKNFIQLPNGFNYNPYQIMGFQNKQTNEFALNVLKSQQFDALQTAHLAGGPPVQAIPGVPIPGTATVVSSVLAPAGPAMPAGALPNWKIGDRCLAKYWEDGGFYNAEITAISESTFVVCFLEYGNYEEVLKTDCIPLAGGPAGPPHPSATMGFHHPQAALGVPQPHPAMMAPHPPPPPAGAYPVQQQQGVPDSQSAAQQQHYNPGYKPQPSQYAPHPHQHGHPPPPHHHQQQRPSKFREQRPMYVPPAQRK